MTTMPANIERYPSFDSMRAAHSQLIKQFSLDSAAELADAFEPVQEFLRTGQATGALLDNDTERESAQTMLDYWNNRLYRIGKTGFDTLLDDFDSELAPEIPDELCPYRGLNAFNEEDASIFFGRQKTISEMIERIPQTRFLAVVGPSGSGKSSIVRAGLLPSLRKGAVEGSKEWVYVPIFVPSSRPLANLRVALDRTQDNDAGTAEIKDDGASLAITDEDTAGFINDSKFLLELVQQRFDSDVVITIDQFEEIFTLCDNETVRRAFVQNLLELVNAEDKNHHVIVTMRVDFESKLALYSELQDIFKENTFRLTPLTAADLRQAIEEPANRIGLKFEEGIIDSLLNDILGEPAALPLLQFTLLKLWELRDRNRITWEEYRHLGGGRQALAHSADEFYNELIPEDQITARRILLRLVRPGEGLEVTSQRMRRLDLYTKSDAADRIDRVLQKFIDARLLRLTRGSTPYDDQIEVAHEALVRNWPTLVAWLEDERETIRQRRRLTTAAERWNELGCSPDLILRGVELEEALRYEDLNALENAFIQASQQARADEVEQAKKVADELRKRNRIITAASIVAAIVAVIAIILGGIAYDNQQIAEDAESTAVLANNLAQTQAVRAENEREIADEQRALAQTAEVNAQKEKETAQAAATKIVAQQATERALNTQNAAQQTEVVQAVQAADAQNIVARARQLADQARSLVSRQTDLGLLLGLEAADLGESFSDQGVLLDVLQANPRLKAYLQYHTGAVNAVAFRPDSRMIASVGSDQNVYLWLTDQNKLLDPLPSGSISSLNAVDFSPNSDFVAAGGCSKPERSGACGTGLLTFWELESGSFATSILEIHRGEVTAIQFDPSGQQIATGGSDGVVYIWKVPPKDSGLRTAEPVFTFTGQDSPIRSLAFSPNGRYLVSSSESNILNVRDVKSLGAIKAFPLQESLVNALAFSPDNRFMAVGREDGNIYIYDMVRFVQIGDPLIRHTYAVTGLDFNPNGTILASSSEDGTVIQWDLSELAKNGKLTSLPNSIVFQGHTDAVLSVAFSPDQNGKILASGGRDSAVIEWYSQPQYPLASNFITSTDAVLGLGFTNDLVVNRINNTITTWDISNGIPSNVEDWDESKSPIRYLNTINKVIIQPNGEILGLQNNIRQVEEVLGVDVSEYEGDVDWLAVQEAGYKFAFTAATEGSDYTDPLFKQNWSGIAEAGLIRGAYHVFYPKDDPILQAEFFADTVPLELGDLPPVVIVEDTEELDNAEVLELLQEFLTELENLTGRKPIIYTSPIFWQSLTAVKNTAQQVNIPVTGGSAASYSKISDYKLWVASYTNANQPELPTGWGTWTFWQFTDQGKNIPGIDVPDAYVNRFNGSLQALQSLAKDEPLVSADASTESTSLINLETNIRIGRTLPLQNPVSAALHPDGTVLALGGENGAINFWNIETGEKKDQVLIYSNASVDSLAFSPDGIYLAAGTANGNVILWEWENLEKSPTVLSGHTSRVISLTYGGQGLVLASGSADGNIILWDLKTNNRIGQPILGPNSSATALSINSAETFLAAGFSDGTVLFWDIDFKSWITKACTRAGRNMTQDEWEKYMEGPFVNTCP